MQIQDIYALDERPGLSFAELLRNFESACMKARRYFLAPKKIIIFLKKNDFNSVGAEAKLIRPSVYPLEVAQLLRELFDSVYDHRDIYRSTGAILLELAPTGTSSTPFSRNR